MKEQPEELPILMSAPMVRATLEDRKGQTRRIVQHVPPGTERFEQDRLNPREWWPRKGALNVGPPIRCPYGARGTVLWVRETWAPRDNLALRELDRRHVFYRADDETHYATDGKWRPGIHMPRWACRLRLRVKDVRIERLQEITEADARAEGLPLPEPMKARINGKVGEVTFMEARVAFVYLWNAINGDREPWDRDPFVFVVSFERIKESASS
jgi:hypothetical protein